MLALVPLSPAKSSVAVTLDSSRVSSASAKRHLLLQDKTLPVSMSSEVHMEDAGCQLQSATFKSPSVTFKFSNFFYPSFGSDGSTFTEGAFKNID